MPRATERQGRMRRWLFALLVSSCALAACKSDPPVARSGPRFLTDGDGRALILRGLNVDNGAKSRLLHAIDMSDEEMRMVAEDMGFNFVRYLVFWDGLEPSPGAYDESYLDRVEVDLDRFWSHGIWVMLDVHQDVYAARFCCDGAPEWAIRDDDQPFELQSVWSLNYLQPAVKRSFDNFWAYTDGAHAELQDHYVAMLRRLAERFRDHPAVLGYDVMNEPHPGSDFDVLEPFDPYREAATSKTFDETKLAPFYQRAIDAIREADGDNFVFFEPRYGAPGNGSRSYLPPLVDPRRGESRLAYAPHLYSVSLEVTGAYGPNDETVALWEERRTEDLSRQGMPLVLGEWGLAFGSGGADLFVADLMEMSERMLLSWAQWSWDPGGPDGWALYDRSTGTLNPMFAIVDRPYPRATAGEPVSLVFDAAIGRLEYTWEERPSVTSRVTEVYVPMARLDTGAVLVEMPSEAPGSWSYAWDTRVPGLLLLTVSADVTLHELVVGP